MFRGVHCSCITPACTNHTAAAEGYLEEALVLVLGPGLPPFVLVLADAVKFFLSLSRPGVLLDLLRRARADHDRDVFAGPTELFDPLHRQEKKNAHRNTLKYVRRMLYVRMYVCSMYVCMYVVVSCSRW